MEFFLLFDQNLCPDSLLIIYQNLQYTKYDLTKWPLVFKNWKIKSRFLSNDSVRDFAFSR